MTTNKECDLLVVGSGAAGLACAITAKKRGLDVVVIEKSPTAHREAETAKAHRG